MHISILTPTLNRGNYLKKIALSIANSKYDLQWIIGDDGSTDDTSNIVKEISEELKIKIKYIKYNERIGKAQLDNVLIDNCDSKYIIWCDAGDFFNQINLDLMVEIADNYLKDNSSKEFIGVFGKTINTKNEYQIKYKIKKNRNKLFNWDDVERLLIGDGAILVNREIIGKMRFPEVDLVINESSLWRILFKGKKIILIDDICKYMDREQIDSISGKRNGKDLNYIMGMYTSIKISEYKDRYQRATLLNKLKINIRYYRYARHLSIIYDKAKEEWKENDDNYICWIAYNLSYVYYIYDLFTKKINHTHIKMKNKSEVKFKTSKFNYINENC